MLRIVLTREGECAWMRLWVQVLRDTDLMYLVRSGTDIEIYGNIFYTKSAGCRLHVARYTVWFSVRVPQSGD